MNRYIFIGPQGSGKGTQAKLLKEKLNIPHISTGDIFRENINSRTKLGIKIKELIDRGELVPDELTNEIVLNRIQKEDCRKGYILDGYPRNIEQARFLESEYKTDKVILIDISDDESVVRISGRRICKECGRIYHIKFNPPKLEGKCECGGELYQREDDKEEAIRERLKIYHSETEPILEFYNEILIRIDGKKSIEGVHNDILKSIGLL